MNSKQELLEQRWKDAVLVTIRCAAFGLAERGSERNRAVSSRHSSALANHCASLEINAEFASELVEELLGKSDGKPCLSNLELAETLCRLYELILNLVPIHSGAGVKVKVADKARKRRGSFYTPKALAKLTVEAALESFLKEPMRPSDIDREQRNSLEPLLSNPKLSTILQLRILDPAMGAGVFLLAAHEHLLHVATDLLEELETSSANKTGLHDNVAREIAQKCIFGVDIDDVAVETAKLALWLVVGDYELNPKTAFPNLRVGNSLVGTCTESIGSTESIGKYPSAIWKRKDLSSAKQEVRQFSRGAAESRCEQADGAVERELSGSWALEREILDRWCAYWFMSREELLTHQAAGIPKEIVRSYKERIKFFHWNAEFPEVFNCENPGFDAVIGNPPWEIEKPNSREFFGSFKKEYWNLGKQDAIKTQEELKERFPQLEAEWLRIYRYHYAMANWVKHAPVQFGSRAETEARSFQYQGRGDANLYKLFVEQAYHLTRGGGAIGLIVPSGIYSDCGTRELRQMLLDECDLRRVFGFDNSDGAFDIHRSFKYCIVAATKGGATRQTRASFMNTAESLSNAKNGLRSAKDELKGKLNAELNELNTDLSTDLNAELNEAKSELNELKSELNTNLDVIGRESIARISPKWSVICEVESKRTLELVDKICGAGIRLGDCEFNGTKLEYAREFDMTLDSKFFHAREKAERDGAIQDIYGNWLAGKWRDPSGSARQVRNGEVSASGSEEIVLSACGSRVLPFEDITKVFIPLYEGRMIGQFDFSEKQWASGKGRQAVWRQSESRRNLGPQYLVELDAYKERRAASFKAAFLAVGSPTNARTMIATCLSEVACGNSVPVFHLPEPLSCVPESPFESDVHTFNTVEFHLILTSILNSFVFDYALRRRMSGNNLNYFVLEECVIPDFANLNGSDLVAVRTIAKCAALLAMDGHRFSNQLLSLGYKFVPSPCDRTARTKLRASVDALIAALYGLSKDEFLVLLTGDGEVGASRQKGFWRVDKNLPQSHSLIESTIRSSERLFEIGVAEFCSELELFLEGFCETKHGSEAKIHGDLLSKILSLA